MHWHWHPDLYIGLLLLLTVYLLLAGPLRNRLAAADEPGPSLVGMVSFAGGVVTLLFALAGPVHELAEEYLFSAHMAQHMMITLVAPPLLLMGTPGWMLRPLVGFRPVLGLARFVTRPAVALAVFTGVFGIWHVPAFYGGALDTHAFHVLEHLVFISTAVILWWPVLSTLPEVPAASPPAQLLYLVMVSISQTPLFAILTFSTAPLYAFYEVVPRLWGLSPLADQQLGGIVMKVAWLVVFLPAICVVFLRWFNRDEMDAASHLQPTG